MKTYQAQLPVARSYRASRWIRPTLPPPRPRVQTEAELARSIRHSVEHVLLSGFWYCSDCDARCERIEGEQGQPAHCDRCGSHRIEWNPPIDKLLKEEVV